MVRLGVFMLYSRAMARRTDGATLVQQFTFELFQINAIHTASSTTMASVACNGTSLHISTQRHFHKNNDDCLRGLGRGGRCFDACTKT